MRVAVGGYLVAMNTFATQGMGLERFQQATLTGDALLKAGQGDSAISGFLGGARERHWEVVPLQFVFPGIGGKATQEAHEWAKETFLTMLGKAGPVDGVFLQLHGTAVAEHIDDCEGDLLAAVRGLLGEKTPLIASLDGHANVTPFMVRAASLLIGVKTNPHYDFVPVGRQAARVMAGMFAGSWAPTCAWAQPAMAPALQKLYIAPGWPMEHLMRLAQNRAVRDSRVLDVSLLGGFFCSEIPETGMSVVVTTHREPNLARDLAEEIKEACWVKRQAFHTDMVSVEDAVREAMATEEGPVVLGDLADSGGAGTPGDGTALLAELLKQNAKSAVIGNIADPAAVQEAIQAGIGKQVTLTVGGKVDKFHGDPVQIGGRVRMIHDGVFTTATAFNAGTYRRGPTVVVDCGGIEVILTSRPVLVFEANHFRSLGIEPTERKILLCKAELQHRAGFAGIAGKFIDVDTPGLATQILSRLPYQKIRRPVFPLDDI
ncbi:MAG: M81 family metallopeptidase [Deltaproteobacteria bacterium]|nr:M81 family metallopeptidase [Deltaproteobacteria bacterium]